MLTVAERVLLHLASFSRQRDRFEAPTAVTQEGVSATVGISRAHAALELGKLRRSGLVEERRGHAARAKTRRKVYYLTEAGEARAAAIKEHARRVPARWRDEAGVERRGPGAEVIDLLRKRGVSEAEAARRVLDGVVDLRPAMTSRDASRVEAPAGFVGRAEELALLRRWLESPDGRVAFLSGLAGIGKTTLARQLAAEARPPVFWYRVAPDEGLRGLAYALGRAARAGGRPALLAAAEDRAGATDLALLIARDLEGLIVVDDAHHAPPLRGLFEELAGQTEGPKVLVCSRKRPEPSLRRRVLDLSLGGLDSRSAAALVAQGGGKATRAVLRGLAGHPLALRLWASASEEEAWRDVRSYLASELLVDLEPEAALFLRRAALFRRPFDPLRVRGGDDRTVTALAARGLFELEAGRCRAHDLLREVVPRGIPHAERASLHEEAAAYWAGQDTIEEAYHAHAAGHTAKALALLAEAAQALVEAGRAEALERMTEDWDPPETDSESWHWVRGLALAGAGRSAEALRHLEPLAGTTDGKRALTASINRGSALSNVGRYGEAVEVLSGAVGRAAAAGDTRAQATALRALGVARRQLFLLGEAQRAAEESLRLFRELGDAREEGRAWVNLGTLRTDRGDFGGALEALLRADALLENHPRDRALVQLNLGVVHTKRGTWAEAVAYGERALELAATSGRVRTQAFALANASDGYGRLGDLPRALDYADRALALAEELEDPVLESTAIANRGRALALAGKWDEAEASWQRSLDRLKRAGARRSLLESYTELAEFCRSQKKPAAARRYEALAERLAAVAPDAQ